jgi:mono/diheme cytochrome c family protein
LIAARRAGSCRARFACGAAARALARAFACTRGAAPVFVLLVTGVGGVRAADLTQADALIERGRYLATAADCEGCHTADPRQPFAGGIEIVTPLGTIVSPNITRDVATGIGAWTDADFYRALHEGIGRDGENLYPAMPYDAFTRLRRDDVLALKAYLFSLPPQRRPRAANRVRFPFDQRWTLSLWKLLNFRSGEFRPDSGQTDSWNRGAYLVTALTHCGECHTPRNVTLGMKPGEALAGGRVGAWQAYNITPDPLAGIGDWSDAEIEAYLSSGVAAHKAAAAGPMAAFVARDTSRLPAQDLADIVAYLRSVTALRSRADAKSRFSWGKLQDEVIDIRGNENLARPTGRSLYFGSCAACHGADGGGTRDEAYPALVGNTIAGATQADDLILCVLDGVRRTVRGETVLMPAFGAELDDREIAALANYVLMTYGNTAAVPVLTSRVAALRGGAPEGTPAIVWLLAASAAAVLATVGAGAVFTVRRALRRP